MPEEKNENQVKSEDEKPEITNSKLAVPQAAIQKLAYLVKLIPHELSAPAQSVLFILIIAAILLLGFGVYMGWSKNPIHCLIAFIATLLLLFVAMFYFLGMKQIAQCKSSAENRKRRFVKNERLRIQIHEEEKKAAQELTQKGRIAWTRDVIALPIQDDERRREIIGELEDIRNGAFSWLNKRHTDIQTSQIRVNIFLAKYEEAGKGVVCMLRMPEYLRIGMSGHTDEEIAFRPGEGATGMAFVEHTGGVAIFNENAGTWDDRYTLTEYQKRKIHKQLRWIITYPLKNRDGEAMAVLNLDCLGLVVNEDELHRLKADLQPKISHLETKLNGYYDKVKISITVEPAFKS
ncbi:MAG: hypothetical protein JXM79_03685 [Sedimentisphaerales bacterium]|nr:hypothetical protein [Sedimentisphaerales bacterium]